MKLMKKVTAVLILFIGMIVSLFSFYLFQNHDVKHWSNASAAAALTAFESHGNIKNDNTYCGAWIDEENIPHIAFTNNDYEKSVRDSGIVYEVFKHSFQELSSLQKHIDKDVTLDSKLNYTSISESENALEIAYLNESDLDDIKTIVAAYNHKQIKINYVYDPNQAHNIPGKYEGEANNE